MNETDVRRLIEDWQTTLTDPAPLPGDRRFGDFCAWLRDHHPECINAPRPATRPFWLRFWFERELGAREGL